MLFRSPEDLPITAEHTKLTRRYFLQAGAASMAALYSSPLLSEAYPREEHRVLTEASSEKPKPNLIFILVDDQGYYDLGCYGAKEFDTPRIDRMAEEGILFTDYYAAAPICSPSRAGILTGCYPRRIGLATWVQRADSRKGIHPDELTLAELLKSSGYATACIGKWHLGFLRPFLPR